MKPRKRNPPFISRRSPVFSLLSPLFWNSVFSSFWNEQSAPAEAIPHSFPPPSGGLCSPPSQSGKEKLCNFDSSAELLKSQKLIERTSFSLWQPHRSDHCRSAAGSRVREPASRSARTLHRFCRQDHVRGHFDPCTSRPVRGYP